MSHIKTASGFECDIDESRLDDYRLMMAVREAQASLPAVVDVVRFVLGKEGETRLVDHLIAAEGRPSYASIEREITEIFGLLGESKKK